MALFNRLKLQKTGLQQTYNASNSQRYILDNLDYQHFDQCHRSHGFTQILFADYLMLG
jgi:hypothetical protein